MTSKVSNEDREFSPRAQRRHFVNSLVENRHLNLLKEDLTENAKELYKRPLNPIPANPKGNVKSYHNAEVQQKLSDIEKDLASMNMGQISKNEIDSILYVSTYQAGYNPKKVTAPNFIKAELSQANLGDRSKKDSKDPHVMSLYQTSFGEDNSYHNTTFNKTLNRDLHSYGKQNILYHLYSPGLKVEEVMVLDPKATVYKTSYENDYSQRKFFKEIPPEQIPIPSSLGSKHNKRNMKFRKWGGYQGP